MPSVCYNTNEDSCCYRVTLCKCSAVPSSSSRFNKVFTLRFLLHTVALFFIVHFDVLIYSCFSALDVCIVHYSLWTPHAVSPGFSEIPAGHQKWQQQLQSLLSLSAIPGFNDLPDTSWLIYRHRNVHKKRNKWQGLWGQNVASLIKINCAACSIYVCVFMLTTVCTNDLKAKFWIICWVMWRKM